MNDQQEFFKKGDSSLGIFYPMHYIVAAYHTLADAEAAEMTFKKDGFADEDARAAGGEFVLQQIEARKDDANWLDRVQKQFSKAIGTEAGYVHEDAAHAQAGGAFLLVYAPDDESADKAKRLFAQHAPAYARRYLNVAIEIIVENPNAL